MCFKKNNPVLVKDRELVLLLAQEIDVLIEMSNNNNFTENLYEVKDLLLYMSPRKTNSTYSYDLKIQNKIGDIKVLLSKADEGVTPIVERNFKELRILIKEREANEVK